MQCINPSSSSSSVLPSERLMTEGRSAAVIVRDKEGESTYDVPIFLMGKEGNQKFLIMLFRVIHFIDEYHQVDVIYVRFLMGNRRRR